MTLHSTQKISDPVFRESKSSARDDRQFSNRTKTPRFAASTRGRQQAKKPVLAHGATQSGRTRLFESLHHKTFVNEVLPERVATR